MPLIESGVNAKAAEHLAAFAKELRSYREEEEERGGVLLRSLERRGANANEANAPSALTLWSAARGEAGALCVKERAILLRAVGRRLGIPTLSRARALELARLMDGSARFEFQWGKGVTVFGDRERLSWVGPRTSD
jgi:hypothetical protein